MKFAISAKFILLWGITFSIKSGLRPYWIKNFISLLHIIGCIRVPTVFWQIINWVHIFSERKIMKMLHYFKVNNCVQVSTTYITQITTAKLNYSNHFQQIVKKLDPVQNSRNVQKKKRILTLHKLTCLVSKYLPT